MERNTLTVNSQWGEWIVIQSPGVSTLEGRNKRHITYLCRCACGVERMVRKYALTNGDSTSCGSFFCNNVGLLNKQWNCLTLVEFDVPHAQGKTRKRYYGIFRCDCGRLKSCRLDHVINGKIKSCGCVEWSRRTLSFEEAAFRDCRAAYEQAAKRRNLSFNLSIEECRELFAEECHYCGTEPSNVHRPARYFNSGNWRYNGIDRLDNGEGYIKNNCVAACKVCNYMKRTMSYDDFMSHIHKISQKHL